MTTLRLNLWLDESELAYRINSRQSYTLLLLSFMLFGLRRYFDENN